ncbi:non-hydrolyzing UDP-N-acetylglucosamine 2-epimerase [Chloroflexota bacterium]
MSNSQGLKILLAEDLQNSICIVVGTRPGIIMFSPIIRELEYQGMDYFVLHTGQHYSYNMDRQFFEDLALKEPDYILGTVQYCKFHGEQTAEMLKGCESVLLEKKPKIVLVGGDANTNLAGALAARKLGVKVGHIEAGERSGDWRMPEEHNRVMIDHISEYLFTTNEKGKDNLVKDNVQGRIYVTGNPIVDAAKQNHEIARNKSTILKEFKLEQDSYYILTLHREENVDSVKNLKDALEGMKLVYQKHKTRIVFLAHPRTINRIKYFGLEKYAGNIEGLDIKEAVGYLDFLNLLANARITLTDSGGVQQESCIFKVPCVTLRESTEWTETIDLNVNILCGTDPGKIVGGVEKMLQVERSWSSPFGDGKSAAKILDVIKREVLEKSD